MAKYRVTGGTPLQGKVSVSGAKNSGFKLLIASLLADSPSQILNVGLISEIDLAKDNIVSLGGSVSGCGDHCLEVDPSGLARFEISKENGEKSRSCTMFIPALLHKFSEAKVPLPGGDKIGVRPLERHYDGLRAMGAQIEIGNGVVTAKISGRLHGTTYHFDKNTHTGTETLLMAAVKADGVTILENAAEEPEVDNMIEFLNLMGGKISRAGRTITIEGVEKLSGAKISIIPDRNEVVAFACMALGTRGSVEILNVEESHLNAFIDKISEIGGVSQFNGNTLNISYSNALKSTTVDTNPYPGFMTDWQSVWTALMTQVEGTSVVNERIFDFRFGYVPSLVSMGAKIELFNPEVSNPEEYYNFNLADDKPTNFHSAKIFGPTPLLGQEVEIKDIRAGATMMMAGLMASGETLINDPLDQIKRGYENLPGKLISLGAKIEVKE